MCTANRFNHKISIFKSSKQIFLSLRAWAWSIDKNRKNSLQDARLWLQEKSFVEIFSDYVNAVHQWHNKYNTILKTSFFEVHSHWENIYIVAMHIVQLFRTIAHSKTL